MAHTHEGTRGAALLRALAFTSMLLNPTKRADGHHQDHVRCCRCHTDYFDQSHNVRVAEASQQVDLLGGIALRVRASGHSADIVDVL